MHYSPYGEVLPGYMFTDTGFWDTFRCLFNVVRTQLFQVQFRLFRADKRRSYTHIYLFALAGFETDQCTGMIVCRFQARSVVGGYYIKMLEGKLIK